MPVTLGTVTFDEAHTAVEESWEEVGGRDERVITINGAIVNETSLGDVEARLDEILDVASAEDYAAALSVRAGRRMHVRRQTFSRSVEPSTLVGAFTLVLAARDPFEEAAEETTLPWVVASSGETLPVMSGGTAPSPLRISVTATDTLVDPFISDGARTIAFMGTVEMGETLVFDGVSRTATLEGEDVTPYTEGQFPEAAPEGVTLTYTDAAESTHQATIAIAFRDRWW